MEVGPVGESAVADSGPPGVWVADGGSDWRKEAGEEGGTMKGNIMEVGWVRFSVVGPAGTGITGSGASAEWLIFLLCF